MSSIIAITEPSRKRTIDEVVDAKENERMMPTPKLACPEFQMTTDLPTSPFADNQSRATFTERIGKNRNEETEEGEQHQPKRDGPHAMEEESMAPTPKILCLSLTSVANIQSDMSSADNSLVPTNNKSTRQPATEETEEGEGCDPMIPAPKIACSPIQTTADIPKSLSSAESPSLDTSNEPIMEQTIEKAEDDGQDQPKQDGAQKVEKVKENKPTATKVTRPSLTTKSSSTKNRSIVTKRRSTRKQKVEESEEKEEDGTAMQDPAPADQNGVSNARDRLRTRPDGVMPVLKNVPACYFPSNHIVIPESCIQTINGNEYGTMKVKIQLRGIAKKKYNKVGKSKNWKKIREMYSVQTVIKDTTQSGKPNLLVIFEGWPSNYSEYQMAVQLVAGSPFALDFARIRHEFCEKLRKKQGDEFKKLSQEAKGNYTKEDYVFEFPNFGVLVKYPNNKYWILEELTFLHTRRLAEAGQAWIFYMMTRTMIDDPTTQKDPAEEKDLPNFHMITNNLLTTKAADRLQMSKFSKTIKELSKGKKVPQVQGLCPSSECKCHQLHQILFKGTPRFSFKDDGLLDLIGFKKDEKKIIIECSDACGCGMDCPNRQIQRGAQVLLAVVQEPWKGYCIRAVKAIKKGTFIAEYMGLVSYGTKDCGKNTSYQADLDAFGNFFIDAEVYGNVGRFPSHSCNPNAAFFDAYSRENESDLFVPRIVIIALEDIGEAEEININYYPNAVGPQTSGIPCKCNSENCMMFMPESD